MGSVWSTQKMDYVLNEIVIDKSDVNDIHAVPNTANFSQCEKYHLKHSRAQNTRVLDNTPDNIVKLIRPHDGRQEALLQST
jgi:hypothetical protein